jgi:hypothetical protein
MSARAGELKYTVALKLIAARYRGRTMRRSYQLDWRTAFQGNWKSGSYEANAQGNSWKLVDKDTCVRISTPFGTGSLAPIARKT